MNLSIAKRHPRGIWRKLSRAHGAVWPWSRRRGFSLRTMRDRLNRPKLVRRGREAVQGLKPVAVRAGLSSLIRWVGVGLAAYVAYRTVQRLREADLRDKVVVITGGSRGLGFLLARAFAREGCRLAICARDGQALRRAREDLISRGATDVFIDPCDVTDRAQVRAFVHRVTDHFGRIDILVNNAGMIQVAPLDALTVQDFEKALDVMFWGMLFPTMAVLPQMRARGEGRIVNITSIGGMISVPHLLPYNCAKFAAVGLSQGLHAELAREGVKVTTIVPGTMRVGSHLNAHFRGHPEQEYGWFALGATVPFVSISGERAARQIVQATKRGEAFRLIGLPARIMERLHGLFPGAMANVMSLINRTLPDLAGARGVEDERGIEAAEKIHSSLFHVLTRRGYYAAEQTNQFTNGDDSG